MVQLLAMFLTQIDEWNRFIVRRALAQWQTINYINHDRHTLLLLQIQHLFIHSFISVPNARHEIVSKSLDIKLWWCENENNTFVKHNMFLLCDFYSNEWAVRRIIVVVDLIKEKTRTCCQLPKSFIYNRGRNPQHNRFPFRQSNEWRTKRRFFFSYSVIIMVFYFYFGLRSDSFMNQLWLLSFHWCNRYETMW